MSLRIRARELRPGDAIVEPWGGTWTVEDVVIDYTHLVAHCSWPQSEQETIPYYMDPSRRLRVQREADA